MISTRIRKSFIYLLPTNSSFLCKPHASFSLSLHLFSTSGKRGGQPVTAPKVSKSLLQRYEVASVVTPLKTAKKSDSVLSFLKESRFSNIQLEKIVKSRRQVLFASLNNTIKPKIKIFQDLGLSADEVAKIIFKEPTILCCSASNRVIPSLSLLKVLLGSNMAVGEVLKRSGWFLIRDLEKSMVPNVEFLKSYGEPLGHILGLLYAYPRCLLNKPKILRNRVEKMEKMGSDRSSKLFIQAVRVVCSMTNERWELKLQTFRDLGFSESDISTMFRKAPQVFAVSPKKIKRIQEVLLATGKYNYPMSLNYSVEKRYMPRLQVLGILEKKNLIRNWPSLATIYLLPDDKFYKKFVASYLNEVGQAYTKIVVSGKIADLM